MATREQQLTEVFVEVADSLIDDFDVIDFLQKLSVHCMELLDVAAVGILLADENDNLHVLAASDEHTRLLELFALQHDQGPCVDCYSRPQPQTLRPRPGHRRRHAGYRHDPRLSLAVNGNGQLTPAEFVHRPFPP